MRIESPFHEGELRAQQLAGERESAQRNGAAINHSIMQGALGFLAQQKMVVFGTRDAGGGVWASVAFGAPGFMHSETGRSVDFEIGRMTIHPEDRFWPNTETPSQAGMLAIELASRRRIRVNGILVRRDTDWMRLDVAEAFPNCPKYIQRRTLRFESAVADFDPALNVAEERIGGTFSEAAQEILATADTLFIASAHETRGVDVSHRGGKPGFARLLDGGTIRIPDFHGNSMFQTLGNLETDPRAGLVVPDFERGRMLRLTGDARVIWKQDDPENETGGTGRFVELRVAEWRMLPLPAEARWEFLDASPLNPA